MESFAIWVWENWNLLKSDRWLKGEVLICPDAYKWRRDGRLREYFLQKFETDRFAPKRAAESP